MLRPSRRTEIEHHDGPSRDDAAETRSARETPTRRQPPVRSRDRYEPSPRRRRPARYADEYDHDDLSYREDYDRRDARSAPDRDDRRRDDRYEDDRRRDRDEDGRSYREHDRRDRRDDRPRSDERYDDRYADDYDDRYDDRPRRRTDEPRGRSPRGSDRADERPAYADRPDDREWDDDHRDHHGDGDRDRRRAPRRTRPDHDRHPDRRDAGRDDYRDDHRDDYRSDEDDEPRRAASGTRRLRSRDEPADEAERPGRPVVPVHRTDVPPDDAPDDAAEHAEHLRGPKKLTVTRVAMYRSRQLTGQAFQAFRRAAHADGADKSGLNRLTYAVMMNYAVDAAIAVALANTLFFSAATGESRGRVALYLLITVAPFALIAPVIGPALDRLQRGRRIALAMSFATRVTLLAMMAVNFDSWLLYPAALGSMVMSKSFGVLKGAVTPRVLPSEITLVETNARLNIFGLAAGGVFGALASGLAAVFDSSGALWFAVLLAGAGTVLCLRIPAWVEVTEGEVPASLSAGPRKARRQPMGPSVIVGLWGSGTARTLTGFLTFFAAFVVKAETEESAGVQVMLLGLIVGAAGLGNFVGNGVGARLRMGRPHQVIVVSVSAALATTVFAAIVPGILTAALVALVGSTASALAKISLDSVVQRETSEESRASAFGRSETILQLAWVFGGVLGLLLPPSYWIGFTVLSVLLVLGLVQTVLAGNGRSLLPSRGFRPTQPPQGRRESPGRPQLGRGRSDAATPGSPSAATIEAPPDR
ncbi:arabinose efflux permease family protein [Actinoalloteichus sp. GBA129-24]|uniref:Arabinose efflux permease family protein n=2 Tax=Pseudonocardiaceae TaxID=2070 RepID=A0AAC9LH97_9PSEU|nr:arabinose efflux permease family protein [Actinoalloteichus fjordicus]APU23748.1 arabinose efflux permease family protein [Actinoalloteichus sp. GBA129-24]